MDKNTDNKEYEEIQKEIRTRFSLLPEDIQKVLVSSEYQMKLYDIAKKMKLTYEQLGVLELETTMVLIGMTEPVDFQAELKGELGLDDNVAAGMVKEINEQVFTSIRESMKKVYAAKEQADNSINDALAGGDTTPTNQVMQKSGITLEKNSPAPIAVNTKKEPTLNRSDIMQGIENPPKTSGLSLAEQKLAGTFSIPTKETVYAPKNITPVAPLTPPASAKPVAPAPAVAPTLAPSVSEKPSTDPYREMPI